MRKYKQLEKINIKQNQFKIEPSSTQKQRIFCLGGGQQLGYNFSLKVISQLNSSLLELLRLLAMSSQTNKASNNLQSQLTKRRQNDEILQKQIVGLGMEKDKQQYSNLIYFKITKQIKKLPQPLQHKLSTQINNHYSQMLKNSDLNVISFYQYIKKLMYYNINKAINKQYKQDGVNQADNIAINQFFNVTQMRTVSLQVKDLYGGAMEIDTLGLLGQQLNQQVSHFQMIKNQYKRNESIMRNIIRFCTQVNKKTLKSKYRSYTTGNDRNLLGTRTTQFKLPMPNVEKKQFLIPINKSNKSNTCFSSTNTSISRARKIYTNANMNVNKDGDVEKFKQNNKYGTIYISSPSRPKLTLKSYKIEYDKYNEYNTRQYRYEDKIKQQREQDRQKWTLLPKSKQKKYSNLQIQRYLTIIKIR